MLISDFDYGLPSELIAQEPPAERGASRLLVLDRMTGRTVDRRFGDLPDLLCSGDLLVVNDTRVFPARLLGKRLPGGGAVECLLLRQVGQEERTEGGSNGDIWEALVHPGQRLRPGSRMEFGSGENTIHGEVLRRGFYGRRSIRLWTDGPAVVDLVDAIGHVPLPPYIKRHDVASDRNRYQTIYAQARGSIAAPTAGLHFTPALFAALADHGIQRAAITLHVGYGTFQPVRVDQIEGHQMEVEHYEVSLAAADAISRALVEHRRVIAVGTTTTRALETLTVTDQGHVAPARGSTNLFIHPGHRFRVISGLITNFHLPRSSLLMIVSAFAGRERLLAAYRHAVEQRYRFYSYGDAMLVI